VTAAGAPAPRPVTVPGAAGALVGGGALVVGYGNTLRGDDGVGRVVAERLADDPRLAGAEVRAEHQLTPELALDASAASMLVLVDASVEGDAGSVSVRALDEGADVGADSSHHIGAAGLLALARELWGSAPPAFVVSVGAASFETGEHLTPAVEAAVPSAVDAVAELLEEHGHA
jgi:hydrogenase maturation protease